MLFFLVLFGGNLTIDFLPSQFFQLLFVILLFLFQFIVLFLNLEVVMQKVFYFLLQDAVFVLQLMDLDEHHILLGLGAINDSIFEDILNYWDEGWLTAFVQRHNIVDMVFLVGGFCQHCDDQFKHFGQFLDVTISGNLHQIDILGLYAFVDLQLKIFLYHGYYFLQVAEFEGPLIGGPDQILMWYFEIGGWSQNSSKSPAISEGISAHSFAFILFEGFKVHEHCMFDIWDGNHSVVFSIQLLKASWKYSWKTPAYKVNNNLDFA